LSTNVSAGSPNVSINNFAFGTANLCVNANTQVTWTNQDGANHSAVSRDPLTDGIPATPAFDTGLLSTNSSANVTFTAAGGYPYRCRPHRSMKAHLTVLE
jgi:plastocyanin